MKKQEIHLIGAKLRGDEFMKVQDSLIKRSTGKKIVLGMLGFIRNEDFERKLLGSIHNLNRGYFRGLEETNSFLLDHLIASYWIFSTDLKDEHTKMRNLVAKVQLIEDLDVNELDEEWIKCQKKIYSSKSKWLYGLIDNYRIISKSKRISSRQRAQLFKHLLETNKTLDRNESWRDIHKKLVLGILDRFKTYPEDLQPNYQEIREFLDLPMPITGQSTIRNQGNWRNKFLYPNMTEVIKEFENRPEIPVYFLIGSLNGEILGPRLKADYSDRNVKFAFSHVRIPEEYKHLAI